MAKATKVSRVSEPAPATSVAPSGAGVVPLEEGDLVLPRVLEGTHDVAVPVGGGVLPASAAATAADVVAAASGAGVAAWMSASSIATRAALAAAMRGLPASGGGGTHDFVPTTRLDEATWVAAAGPGVAVLRVTAAGALLLVDPTGEELLKTLRAFARGEETAKARLEVAVRRVEDLGAPWDRPPVAGVWLRERLRLLVVDVGLSVGRPAGTLTLLPGEAREFQVSTERTRSERARRSTDVLEKASTESAQDFSREFNAKDETSDERRRSVEWRAPGSAASGVPAVDGSVARTVREVAERATKTVERQSATRSAEVSVRVASEAESASAETQKDARKITFKNPTSQCVTFVYHRLNSRHVALVDLDDVEVVVASGPARCTAVPFPRSAADWEAVAALAVPGRGEDLVAAVAAAARERYDALGALEGTAARPTLVAPPADDPQARRYDRAALLGPRRREGALPLTMERRDVVVETDGLHAVPRPSALRLDVEDAPADRATSAKRASKDDATGADAG